MRILRWLIIVLCSTAHAEMADEAAHVAPSPEEILVTGEFPGPGMWKVTRADDPEQHTLWILGTPPPLPKKLQWKSKEVEQTMLDSQEILLPSEVKMEADQGIGFFRGLTLMPAALGARKNPNNEKLEDVLTPELHARWLTLKKRHLGRSQGIERWRPLFAAFKLRGEAFDDYKFRENGLVWDTLAKLADKHKIDTTTPTVHFTVKTKEIRSKIKEFARESLADTECFALTLDLVAAMADQDTMHARASAWATGDVEALMTSEALPNPNTACAAAIMSSQVAQTLLPLDVDRQLRTAWLDAAEHSLSRNRSTFALLPIAELTASDGQLDALRAKGYHIEAPARE